MTKRHQILSRKAVSFCTCLFLVLCYYFSANAQQKPERLLYIEKYKDIAISEMERAGVPASIKLAQALLESNSGKSTLARKANNHFGMKCGNQWKGKTYYKADDDYDEEGNLLESCFRVFKDPETSFIAHSEFLRNPRKNSRYGFLFKLDPMDYERWALGLKKAGYATNPRYPDLLIGLIETYELYVYDGMSTTSVIASVDEGAGTGILMEENFKVNTARVAIANAGETVEDVAIRSLAPPGEVLKYNEDLTELDQVLDQDYRVFLQPKRAGFRGKQKYHYVKAGETMFDISQLYGVKLENLHKRNRLDMGRNAATGERIKIRGWKVAKAKRPKIRRKGEKNRILRNLPMKDMDQDPEVEFDTDSPATAIEEFEAPRKKGSLIPDDLKNGQTQTKRPPRTTTTTTTTSTTAPSRTNTTTTRPPRNNNTRPSTSNNNTRPPRTNTTKPSTTNSNNTNKNNNSNSNSSNYYTVKDGDTLYRLAKKFGTSVPNLRSLNGLDGNIISPGQRLRIK